MVLVGAGVVGSKGVCLDSGGVGMGGCLVSIGCLFSLLTGFSIILSLVLVAACGLGSSVGGVFLVLFVLVVLEALQTVDVLGAWVQAWFG